MKSWKKVAKSFSFLGKSPYSELFTFPAKLLFEK